MSEDDFREEIKVGMARLNDKQDVILDRLKKQSDVLFGKDHRNGLVLDVDRLNTSAGRQAKLVWLAIGGAVAGAWKSFFH